jgi:hypothetical protein
MGKHFIHFNRRQVRMVIPGHHTDPWFAEAQSTSGGFYRPKYHITRATSGPTAQVEPGDTIWLIGQLYSPWGNLPPAIDARIDVAQRTEWHGESAHGQGSPQRAGENPPCGFRFQAAQSSRWFCLADVSAVLPCLQTQRSDGRIAPLHKKPEQPIGHALRRMRRLVSGEPLLLWEQALEAQAFHFVSYRLRDGTRSAFDKVKALVAEGVPLFWDHWSLPRRLAERREVLEDTALNTHIKGEIARAAVVWGIDSPLYHEAGSYSARERELVRRLGTFRAE